MIGATICAVGLILGFIAVGIYFIEQFIVSVINLDWLEIGITGFALIMYIAVILMLYGV